MGGKTILVIEDDKLLTQAYRSFFEKRNYIVELAQDGQEGYETALRTKPDAIVLDLKMPKMDGMTVLKNLRADVWGKGVPVIILTNLDMNDGLLENVVEHQPSYYLLKASTKLEDLLKYVQTVTGEIESPNA